jgi:uncharacterized protein with HEPN domain
MQPRQAAYLAGYDRERFLGEAKTQDAVLRRLLVIGEADVRLTPESCAEFPEIPFPRIVGMRNRVVHDYGHVDLEIIWEVVQIHLPPLFAELRRFFEHRGEPTPESI